MSYQIDADGYYEVVKPTPLPFVEDDHTLLPYDTAACDIPVSCRCHTRFSAETMINLRRVWMRSNPVTYDGERKISDEAWRAAQVEHICCKKELMTFVPVMTLHEVYDAANAVYPADWCFEKHVFIDDKKAAGITTKLKTTATTSFYENPRQSRLGEC